MRYFLKKCGFQELGSVVNGKAQRGRYLMVSKRTLDFFPPLTTAQLNDSAILPIIPLYSGEKVYCNYVYHNDKYHNHRNIQRPRDEYRLYLNLSLEQGKHLIGVDDIVILRQEEIEVEGETQSIYLLDLLQNKNTALYRELNTAIVGSDIRGDYAFYDGEISEFEEKVATMNQPSTDAVTIDSSVTKRIEDTNVANLFNSVSFRDFVMVGYQSLCAVTGTVIRYESYMNLEAAHIKPRSHGGLFMPNNGIALCRDLHWAFDKGFFTLNNNCEVKIHPKTTSEYLRSFDGQKIRLPQDPFFRPDTSNIEYHSQNVYGLFLTSGRL
ncbi:hypothetical protein FACS189499_09380 [Clostridia bacterium]|nr:hypothetical protein FACS189499_09380 [Clostridia bacterium]